MTERDTPRRLPLPSATVDIVEGREEGNGNRPHEHRGDVRETQWDRVERVVLETQEQLGLLARDVGAVARCVDRVIADGELHRGETRRIADSVALLSANAHARAPMPSFSFLEHDSEHEIITQNGSRRLTHTQEQIVAMARAEYLKLQADAQLAKDAAPVAFVRAQLVPAVALKIGTWGALGVLAWLVHLLLSHFHL